MHIEDLEEKDLVIGEKCSGGGIVSSDAKRALVGAGARALFYPTLLYNVIRNKFQAEFRWWDRVDEFILLGAVPFPSDVPRLKTLGVHGVITLNEPYETLVPTSLYHAYDIDHLVIPTRDYLFAPSMGDICQAVDFIHGNASTRRSTYVHCKAGRGRSTTIVMCYLVQHKQMTPDAAYAYLRSIRPRVLLATAQREAVQQYYRLKVLKTVRMSHTLTNLMIKSAGIWAGKQGVSVSAGEEAMMAFDDSSVVVITTTDLEGYEPHHESDKIWADLSVVYRARVAGQSALARLSCFWLHQHKMSSLMGPDRLNVVDIQVY